MTEMPAGSGDICTPRMSALIAKAGSGVLATSDGGEELRGLYRKGRDTFTLCPFLLIDPLHPFANSQCSVAPCLFQRVYHDVRHR